MQETIEYLTTSGVQYLATSGLDGKPKVRPFQFMFAEGGRLWFCTSCKKQVYKELQQQPWVELCATGEKMSWLRLAGQVVFANKIEIKDRIFEVSPLVRDIYKNSENPDLVVFYLKEAKATFSEIGKPSRMINLQE